MVLWPAQAWEFTVSERSPTQREVLVQSRGAQRAPLSLDVYTAERHSALDISRFPSWNSQITITLKLQVFQGCQAVMDNSLFWSPLVPGNRSPWYGQCSSIHSVQEFLLWLRAASLPNPLHKGQGLMGIFEITYAIGRMPHHTITHHTQLFEVCWFLDFTWLGVFLLLLSFFFFFF